MTSPEGCGLLQRNIPCSISSSEKTKPPEENDTCTLK